MIQWLSATFRQAAWAPIAVFIFYAVAAKGFHAYLLYPWLDMPTHFFGGAAMAYFFIAAIGFSQPLIGAIPPLAQRVMAVGLTMIVAVIWEFLEYASDVFRGSKMNLGVADTLMDLFLGLLGGTVAAGLARLRA
jgi:hypothetical protein